MKQNLLLITFDQLRADWFNPYMKNLQLRHLKAIAEKGRTFTRCYTRSPQCVPARLSWLTGKMPSRFGVTKNCKCTVKDGIPSIFQDIRNKGWYTELIGKTHWTEHTEQGDLRDYENLIRKLGFENINEVAGPRALRVKKCYLTDEWEALGLHKAYKQDINERYKGGRVKEAWKSKPSILPNELYPDIWIADKACEAIRDLPTEKPWFLWISFVGPHEPFDTPKEWKDRCNVKVKECLRPSDLFSKLPKKCELYKNKSKWENTFTKQEAAEFRRDYGANIELLDQQLGKIMNELEIRDDKSNTITMLTADHGEMLGDYNMLYKSTFLEPAINVPLIISSDLISKKNKVNKNSILNSSSMLKAIIDGIANEACINKILRTIDTKKKQVIEYGDERCFIYKNQKLVRKSSGEIMWRSIIHKFRIGERLIEDNRVWKKEWEELEQWSLELNKKLNQKSNRSEHLISKD